MKAICFKFIEVAAYDCINEMRVRSKICRRIWKRTGVPVSGACINIRHSVEDKLKEIMR